MKLRHNIFVSSTFQDMHYERDMLHSVVVPELTSYFSKKRLSIDLIDLRWGIDTSGDGSEQENTVKILKVCFDEIERSKPFFIGFIGERYGWIPNSNDIESAILGYNFDSEGREMSITEMEMLYALQKFDTPENCLFFIRNGLNESDIEDEATRAIYFPSDPALKDRCDRLKAYLRDKYKDTTFDYNCYWDKESNTLCGLEELCSLLTSKLIALIEKMIGSEYDGTLSAIAEERALQESVLADIQQNTFGRGKEINDLIEFAQGEENELLVSATSGLGKSSLLAGFCGAYDKNALVIPFFAGISARSTDFRFLARYLYATLTGNDDDSVLEIPYSELKKRLLGALFDASSDKKVVIVVDALDQFAPSRELYSLDFINEQLLPKNVKIIYSALPDFVSALKKRSTKIYELNSLSKDDIKAVARGISSKLHKELSDNVLELLTAKTDENGDICCTRPIYLVLLLELLCSFDSDDFAEINRTQSSENLSPALAIQRYLERTILRVGTHTKDALDAICAKTILQLGKKYDVITALLTSGRDGISEKDILGITALTDTPVSVADFSLYRRMFRMHLIQRENENWVFNHAVIRNAQASYALCLDNTSLYEACAKYYISLPEDTQGKYSGIIRFLGKLGRYSELIPYALLGKADSVLVELLISKNNVLDACDENSIFALCTLVYNQISRSTGYGATELISLFTAAIKACLGFDYKQNTAILSSMYFYLGKLLIENSNSRGRSFLEISTGILLKTKGTELCAQRALEICELLRSRDDSGAAEKYALVAYKCIKNAPKNELYATVCYTLAACVRDNPLSLRKPLGAKYLTSALYVAKELGLKDLYVKCATEYLKLAPAVQKKTVLALASEAVLGSDEGICDASLVQKQIYLAEKNNDLSLYKSAYENAIFALARDSSLSFMLLYQGVLEKYFYRLLLDDDKEQCDELLKRLDSINKKLYLVSGDITFIDKRLCAIHDYKSRFGTKDEKILNEANGQIQRELKKKSSDFKRKKDVYTSLAIKLGIIGFVAYLIIQFIIAIPYYKLQKVSFLMNAILTNTFIAFVNILMVVVIFYALMLISSPHKRTYNYNIDHRSFVIISSVTVALLVPLLLLTAYSEIRDYSVKEFAKCFYLNVSIELLCIVYACTITYFLAYLINLIIMGPFKKSNQNKIAYLYKGKELILKHVKMLIITLVPIVCFVPCLFIEGFSDSRRSLDLTGLKPDTYARFCYIPFLVQLGLTILELCILRARYGKIKVLGKTLKGEKKHLGARLIILASTVVVIICTMFVGRVMSINESARQNNCYVEKEFIYQIYESESITYAIITGYYGNKTEITIPGELGGYDVYIIHENAFRGDNLTSVTVSEGIKHINEGAFKNCANLKSVYLPKSVSKLEYGAFENCTQLTTVVSSRTEEIDVGAELFYNSGITTSDSVLENGIYVIGNTVAYVDKEYSGRVVIPEGVTILEPSLFSYARGITEVVLPSTLVEIGKTCFYKCENLTTINLNENITIGERAFEYTRVSVE